MKMQIYTDFIFKYICLVIDYTDGVFNCLRLWLLVDDISDLVSVGPSENWRIKMNKARKEERKKEM